MKSARIMFAIIMAALAVGCKDKHKTTSPAASSTPGIRVLAKSSSQWFLECNVGNQHWISFWNGSREDAMFIYIPQRKIPITLNLTERGLVLVAEGQTIGPIPYSGFSFASGPTETTTDGSIIIGKTSKGTVEIRLTNEPNRKKTE